MVLNKLIKGVRTCISFKHYLLRCSTCGVSRDLHFFISVTPFLLISHIEIVITKYKRDLQPHNQVRVRRLFLFGF